MSISTTRVHIVERGWFDEHFLADTHAASRDVVSEGVCLECHRVGCLELIRVLDGGQPEAVCGGVVITSTMALAFDERIRAKVLQARARR